MSSSQSSARSETSLAGRPQSPQDKMRVAAWVKQVQLAGKIIEQPSMTNNIEDEPKYEKVFKGFVFRKFNNQHKTDETEKKDDIVKKDNKDEEDAQDKKDKQDEQHEQGKKDKQEDNKLVGRKQYNTTDPISTDDLTHNANIPEQDETATLPVVGQREEQQPALQIHDHQNQIDSEHHPSIFQSNTKSASRENVSEDFESELSVVAALTNAITFLAIRLIGSKY